MPTTDDRIVVSHAGNFAQKKVPASFIGPGSTLRLTFCPLRTEA